MKNTIYDSNKIKEARENRGLTLSAAAGLMEATRTQYTQWERGDVTPTANTLAKMCRVFKKSPAFFFIKNGGGEQ